MVFTFCSKELSIVAGFVLLVLCAGSCPCVIAADGSSATATAKSVGSAASKKWSEDPANRAKLTREVNDPAFQKVLLQIAAKYPSFGRTDTGVRRAPFDCVIHPAHAFVSGSDDGTTHGQKLYYLYVKNLEEYLKRDAPTVGQAIVKESYHPLGPDSYELGEKYGLFIMTKLDRSTPGADEGWVYGTVSGDGKKVLSAGRVQSCMKCHTDAPHDRLFGLKGRVYLPYSKQLLYRLDEAIPPGTWK